MATISSGEPETISESTPGSNASSSTTNATTSRYGTQSEPAAASGVKKIPFWKRTLAKLGFNLRVVTFMVKGALPPTICMAIYQRHSVALHYLNLGYLMIIVSILTVPILPRGKFLMNLVISLVGVQNFL
jgi:hypothetical protein